MICLMCSDRPRASSALDLCRPCIKAYERTEGEDMHAVLIWAIKRTRYFERRRTRLALRLQRAGLLREAKP